MTLKASPIQRFLGAVNMEHGPYGLLNLPPRMHDAQTINKALAMQLARLARHPQGMSTEADEVRLALHVAAAQLRDPEVQREVLVECSYPIRGPEHAPQATPAARAEPQYARRGARETTPRAPTSRAATLQAHTSQLAMFERAALWVLVHSGGWNKEAQRRLASLAHTFGVDQEDFHRALGNLGRRSRSGRAARHASAAAHANGHRAGDEHDDDASGADGHEPELEPEPITVPSLVRLSILILLTVLTGVMAWRLVTIRADHLASSSNLGATSSGTGSPIDPLVERTITMPDLPPPLATQPDDDPSDAPLSEEGEAPLPLPASPDAELPAGVNVDRVIADWDRRARTALERADRASDHLDHLEHAVRLAQVNLAAAQHWSGAANEARATLRSADSYRPPRMSVTTTEQRRLLDLVASLTAAGDVRDGDLAMLFLLAKRQPQRYLPELRQIRIGAEPLGPVDADLVAESILFAAPNELRQLAASFAIQQAENPVMVYALLEALADAPRHEAGSEIIQQVTGRRLPHPREEHWALEARRALVGRLFELLGGGADPGVDELARQLAQFVSRRAVALGATDTRAPASPISSQSSVDPVESVRTLARRWRDLGETYMGAAWFAERTLQLEHRRDLRLALARGPIQRFAAEHASAIEHMAELVRAERPSQSRAIDRVLDRLNGSRQTSGHVFEQIAAGERAITQLWRLRFGI